MIRQLRRILHKSKTYTTIRFRILVVKDLLRKPKFPVLFDPPPNFRSVADGQVRICNEEFVEVQNLSVSFSPGKADRLTIGGNSVSEKSKVLDLPEKQDHRRKEVLREAVAADLTIDQPALLCPLRRGNIALTTYEFYQFYKLLKIYDLKPKDVIVVDGPRVNLQDAANFHSLYEKAFGGVKHIDESSWVLLKRALFLAKTKVFHRTPSIYHFRDWLTRSFQRDAKKKTESVKKIVFIERTVLYYETHTRNVERKVANADELCDSIRAHFSNCDFVRVRLELLPMIEQIGLLADADVVVSTHGAGLIFAANMVPENAAIVELLPANMILFHALYIVRDICRLRKVHYERFFRLRRKCKISKGYNDKYSPFEAEEIVDYYQPKRVIKKIAKAIDSIERNADQ